MGSKHLLPDDTCEMNIIKYIVKALTKDKTTTANINKTLKMHFPRRTFAAKAHEEKAKALLKIIKGDID